MQSLENIKIFVMLYITMLQWQFLYFIFHLDEMQ